MRRQDVAVFVFVSFVLGVNAGIAPQDWMAFFSTSVLLLYVIAVIQTFRLREFEAEWVIKRLDEAKLDVVSDGQKYHFDGYVRVHHGVVKRAVELLRGKP